MDGRLANDTDVIREQGSQIYSCDDPVGLSLLSRTDLPREKWERIRRLQQRKVMYNWKILFFVLLWALAGYTVLNVELFVVQMFCYFAIAFSLMGLPNMMHEALHGLLFKNPSLNRWVGFLCGVPGLVSVSAYRYAHLLHHAHARTEKDPDDIEASARKSMPLVLFYYLFLVVGIYLYIPNVAVNGLRAASRQVRRNVTIEYTLMLGLFGIAFWIFPVAAVLKVWLYPILIAAQISNVRGLAEHGLTTGGNVFTATRTVLSNKFVSFMMCNLNYHLEHHLFPGVPWYNLPKIYSLLQEEYRRAGSSVYLSYTDFLIDFFKISWAGIIPGLRMIPEHIREDICA